MTKQQPELKAFNLRVPKETWLFLKRISAEQEISMTQFVVRCIEDYRKKLEK